MNSKGFYVAEKIVVLSSRPPENVKLGTFTLWSCNDGNEIYKKA